MKECFTTISLKPHTYEKIRNEAEATGMKMYALVDHMAENYIRNRGND